MHSYFHINFFYLQPNMYGIMNMALKLLIIQLIMKWFVLSSKKKKMIIRTCITYGIILSLITIDAHDLILEKS